MDKYNQIANRILLELGSPIDFVMSSMNSSDNEIENRSNEIEKLLKKDFEDQYGEKDTQNREFSNQMEALDDDIYAAIIAKDKKAHLAVLRKYNDIRNKAIEHFGIDGPVHLIDPDLAGCYSDDFKSENGIRPRSDSLTTFRAAIEFYKNGEYGSIEGNEFIEPELKSYIGEPPIEDQEAFLNKSQQDAIKMAQTLANDPTRRSFQKDPQKEINKAYGDVMKKIANKIKTIQI